MTTENNKLFSTRAKESTIEKIKDYSAKTGKKIYAIFEDMVTQYLKGKHK